MTVHLKFTAVAEVDGEVRVASGIIMNCPSIEALRTKLEDEMELGVINIDEATAEEVAEASRAKVIDAEEGGE